MLTVFKGLFLLRIYCRRSEKCGDYRYASGHEYRHDGSLSTGHGNSPKDMIGRLETGKAQYGLIKANNGYTYYFQEGGKYLTGFQIIEDRAYYFSSGGVMMTGYRNIDNKRYYFDESGVCDYWIKTVAFSDERYILF